MATIRLASSTHTDWNQAAIWAAGALPTAGDTVVCENVTTNVDTEPAGTNDVEFAALRFDQSYVGLFGGPTTGLGVKAVAVDIGFNYGPVSPAGSDRINLDLTGVTTSGQITVHDTSATAEEDNQQPVRLVSDTFHSVVVNSGDVGLATNVAGETAAFAKVSVGFIENEIDDAAVNVGVGVTVANYVQTGGNNTIQAGITAITASGGVLRIVGTGAITSLIIGGGAEVFPEASGTITIVANSGNMDMTRNQTPRTITTLKAFGGSTTKIDGGIITLTNPLELDQTSLENVTLEVGFDRTLDLA